MPTLQRYCPLALPLLALVMCFWRPAHAEPAVAEAPAPVIKTEVKTEAKPAAEADHPADHPGGDWVRVLEDDQGQPIGMQTAIVRYQSPAQPGRKQVTVDLVGAIHVGDLAYYQDLNKRFEAYDALLYELVAPQGTRIEPGQRASNRHALGAMQNMMKDTLELEHQLEKVDYTKANFVHADMSPDEFFDSMATRDESFLKMYFRLVGQSIAHQSKLTSSGSSPDIDMVRAMFAKDRARYLKIAMAKQLAEMESLLTAFGGEEGSTLITERNKAALKVLREQIDGGKVKLGVFYGAGHLADMDERLRKEFGMQPSEVTWLTAWDLSEKKK